MLVSWRHFDKASLAFICLTHSYVSLIHMCHTSRSYLRHDSFRFWTCSYFVHEHDIFIFLTCFKKAPLSYVLRCVALRCSVLLCGVVCCSVLQCVAVYVLDIL